MKKATHPMPDGYAESFALWQAIFNIHQRQRRMTMTGYPREIRQALSAFVVPRRALYLIVLKCDRFLTWLLLLVFLSSV